MYTEYFSSLSAFWNLIICQTNVDQQHQDRNKIENISDSIDNVKSSNAGELKQHRSNMLRNDIVLRVYLCDYHIVLIYSHS